MMRAMLADRFKLVAHVEPRPQQVFELVVARADRRLGKSLTPIEADCAAQAAVRRATQEAALYEGRQATFQRPDFTKPPPRCEFRSVTPPPIGNPGGPPHIPATRLEGEAAIADLAPALRMFVGRTVVDKTGLTGSYRFAMDFDWMAARRPPDVVAPPESGPSLFTALQEQLGLKLQPATASRDTLVVDRIERPSEN